MPGLCQQDPSPAAGCFLAQAGSPGADRQGHLARQGTQWGQELGERRPHSCLMACGDVGLPPSPGHRDGVGAGDSSWGRGNSHQVRGKTPPRNRAPIKKGLGGATAAPQHDPAWGWRGDKRDQCSS